MASLPSPSWQHVRRPEGPPLATALPTWRWSLVHRSTPRYHLPLDDRGHDPLSRFLRLLTQEWRGRDLHLLDANLWFDGGQGEPTGYHNDLWFSVPLANPVFQVWIPLVGDGDPREVARSMLRLDPQPMSPGWACAPGRSDRIHVWNGETQPLPYGLSDGRLREDLPGAIGGAALQVGDILLFHNAHAHYTLPSRARRVGLALRLCQGVPVYNGYFAEPRPLDQRSASEGNRRSIAALLRDLPPGTEVPAQRFLYRLDTIPWRLRWRTRAIRALLLFSPARSLDPVWAATGRAITESLATMLVSEKG